MNRDEKSKKAIEMMYFIIDCIQYYQRISTLKDCNNCGRKECEFMPKPGETVRINCPLWEDKT